MRVALKQALGEYQMLPRVQNVNQTKCNPVQTSHTLFHTNVWKKSREHTRYRSVCAPCAAAAAEPMEAELAARSVCAVLWPDCSS